MIALRPAHEDQDRASLIRRIIEDEPPRLRQLAPETPVDLETIVTKSMEKDPSRRYASAGELAADLRRFIAHEPIAARPVSLLDRSLKWSRRHRNLVRAVSLAVAVLAGTWTFNSLRVRRALEETSDLLYAADMGLAFQAWEHGWTDEVQRILERQRPHHSGADRRGVEWHLLNQVSQQPRGVVLTGHKGPVTEISVFPDRRRMASVGEDGTLRLWDLRANSLIRTIQVCNEGLHSVSISPDGRYVAVGSTTAYLVDIEGESPPKPLFRHDSNMESLAFSNDGKTIAAGIRYHEICLFSTSGEMLNRIPCDSRSQTLEFDRGSDQLVVPNRRQIGAASPCGVIEFWSADLSDRRRELTCAAADLDCRMTHARLSPCGDYLAAGESYRSTVHVIPLKSGKITASTPISRDKLTDLAYSPDGGSIAIGYENGIIECHALNSEADSDPTIGRRPRVIKAHESEVLAVRYVTARRLASCGSDGSIRVWSLGGEQGGESHLSSDLMNDIEISPDGDSLLYVCEQEFVLADAQSGDVRYRQSQPDLLYARGAWAPSSDRFAVGCRAPASAAVYGLDGRLEKRLTLLDEPVAIRFSPTGETLAALSDGAIEVWELPSYRKLSEHPLRAKGYAIAYSHSGRRIACGGALGEILLVTPDGRGAVQRISCGDAANCLAFAPDDALLATGHLDGVIRLWNLASGEAPLELIGHERQVTKIVFSPDGRTLISSGHDGSTRLWSVAHGRGYGRLTRRPEFGNQKANCDFSMSMDGRFLATGYRTAIPSIPDVVLWSLQ
jgi:WD40 repeat protein